MHFVRLHDQFRFLKQRILHICLLIVTCTNIAWAQWQGLEQKTIRLTSDSVVLDSFAILPTSIHIKGLDTTQFRFNSQTNALILSPNLGLDSIQISYRKMAIPLNQVYYNKDTNLIEEKYTPSINPFSITNFDENEMRFSQSRLEKSGNLSRGISVGNNQNMGVQSNLQLQLSGYLTDNLRLNAAIADQNIPVQPNGNTQVIQDFDQVYIQLIHPEHQLTAGDFRLKNHHSYFSVYDKKLRGIGYENSLSVGSRGLQTESHLSGAVSRGKFARNQIQGIEGNQGPYRLNGGENEQFIVILSGTEKVYIDGRLLQRGQNKDYVIDYNLSEITFTAQNLITKDRRIIIEFQYVSQAYGRSLIAAENQWSNKKFKAGFSMYSESDNENNPFQQNLSDEEVAFLSTIGDDVNSALVPSANTVEFENDRVLYRVIPYSQAGIDSIFEYSTNPDSATYQVTFTEVNPGQGNYILQQSTANGRVYEFIDPINGISQGNYVPAKVLITPKQRQVFEFNGAYTFNENSRIEAFWALSNYDANRYSTIDDADNVGNALKANFTRQKQWKATNWASELTAGLEFVDQNFQAIEWFRSAEFERDWNLLGFEYKASQYLPEGGLLLNNQEAGFRSAYQFQGNYIEDAYAASRHKLNTVYKANDWHLRYTGSLTQSDFNDSTQADFYRHKTLLSKTSKHIQLGYEDEFENNAQSLGDSLSQSAYSFWNWKTFLRGADTSKVDYKIYAGQRLDDRVIDGNLQRQTSANEAGGSVLLRLKKGNQAGLLWNYRDLQVNDTTSSIDPAQTNTLRATYNLRFFKNALVLGSFYEFGSGLEEVLDFLYLEVSPGQGIYAWIDYNENGIKEQNEFEIAPFPDQANYIRVVAPSNQFVQADLLNFSQSVQVNFYNLWNQSTGIRKFMSHLQNQASYRLDRKAEDESNINRWNPFEAAFRDSGLISSSAALRNTLYWNRTHPIYGLEYTIQNSGNQQLTSSGISLIEQQNELFSGRVNFLNFWKFTMSYQEGVRQSFNELAASRNFKIPTIIYKADLNYTPRPTLQTSLSFEQKDQNNTLAEEAQQGTTYTTKWMVKWSKESYSLETQIAHVQLNYVGSQNNSAAFEMLNGLTPGTNYTWLANYQQQIGKNIQASIIYNGRMIDNGRTIHTGNMSVRVYF